MRWERFITLLWCWLRDPECWICGFSTSAFQSLKRSPTEAISTRGGTDSRSRAVIVDPEDRIRVMGAVCAAVGCLIDVAEPLGIKMQTHTADLPLKALMKYDRVSTVFTDRGYEGGKTEHYHGLWFYEFERVATVSNVSPDEPLSTDDPEGI